MSAIEQVIEYCKDIDPPCADDASAELAEKVSLLLEMFQALAGVLGDDEHRGAIRPATLEACRNAVTHWLEITPGNGSITHELR